MDEKQLSRVGLMALVVGPLLAIGIAWLTESSNAGLALANVALLLAAVAVVAALLSWQAGIATSVVAGLALNYFHTVPVHSLRMTEGAEIVTVALLISLGAVVSAATAWRVRRRTFAQHSAEGDRAAARLRELLEQGGSVLAAWHAALDGTNPQLGLLDVRLVVGAPASLPLVARHDAAAGDVVVLPETGAAVRLAEDERFLVLRPQHGIGALTVDRRALLSFADQLAATLAAS
ncbi:MAG: DUF4118 domain-containing protein [Ilumatobacteraceae bacterium]